MYKTIEADIEDGKIKGLEEELPRRAHVLITVLESQSGPCKRPEVGTRTSPPVKTSPDAFDPLTEEELIDWGMA